MLIFVKAVAVEEISEWRVYIATLKTLTRIEQSSVLNGNVPFGPGRGDLGTTAAIFVES